MSSATTIGFFLEYSPMGVNSTPSQQYRYITHHSAEDSISITSAEFGYNAGEVTANLSDGTTESYTFDLATGLDLAVPHNGFTYPIVLCTDDATRTVDITYCWYLDDVLQQTLSTTLRGSGILSTYARIDDTGHQVTAHILHASGDFAPSLFCTYADIVHVDTSYSRNLCSIYVYTSGYSSEDSSSSTTAEDDSALIYYGSDLIATLEYGDALALPTRGQTLTEDIWFENFYDPAIYYEGEALLNEWDICEGTLETEGQYLTSDLIFCSGRRVSFEE